MNFKTKTKKCLKIGHLGKKWHRFKDCNPQKHKIKKSTIKIYSGMELDKLEETLSFKTLYCVAIFSSSSFTGYQLIWAPPI